MIKKLRDWLSGKEAPLPEPLDKEIRYRIEEVGGYFFVYVYREYDNLFAESYTGPRWDWWRAKHDRFTTPEQAKAFGEQCVADAKYELAQKAADLLASSHSPRW